METDAKNPVISTMANVAERRASKKLWVVILYAFFVAVVLVFEFRHELFASHDQTPTEAEVGDVEGFGYRLLTAAGYRTPRARRVTLVLLDTATEGHAILRTPCLQREFLSVVVQNLEEASAAGIVIDKYYETTTCKKDDPKSQRFGDILSSARTPVTLGVVTGDELRSDGTIEVEKNNLFDPLGPPGEVRLGLVELNHDTKKIPLEWQVAFSEHVRSFPSLSLVAAERADGNVRHELGSLIGDHRHPYAAFIRPEHVPTLSAAQVYCRNPRVAFEGIDCNEVPAANVGLAGSIAVIGDAKGDTHPSVLGEVAGVRLHANYIEALLEQGYFVPLGKLPSSFLIGFGVIAIQLLFWRTEKPELALGGCFAAFVAASIIGYLLLVQFQFILPPVAELGGLIIFTLLRYVDTRAHGLHRHSIDPPAPGLGATATATQSHAASAAPQGSTTTPGAPVAPSHTAVGGSVPPVSDSDPPTVASTDTSKTNPVPPTHH